MAQRANGSALPPIDQTLPDPPLTLATSIPLSPCDGFLTHTMKKHLLNMTGPSTFCTERPPVNSTLVPLALTASGALSHHNTQHTADWAHPLERLNSNFRDSAGSSLGIYHFMEEDSLDKASTPGILNSLLYRDRGTIQEESSHLAANWDEIYSAARETSELRKSTASVEEHNDLEDSQSVLSELSSEDRSLSPKRDQPTSYFDVVNNKNKNKNNKIAPWRVLKPIVLKPFIALQPQDI